MGVTTGAPRRGLVPVRLRGRIKAPDLLIGAGGMTYLVFQAFAALLKPPYSWRGEFLDQSHTFIRRCFFPTILANVGFALAIDPPAGQIVQLLGTVDRLGSFYVNAAIREFGPFITAMVLAGVAGCATTADLGARKVREEISALQSLGIDPMKSIVAPRFLALVVVTVLMTVFGVLIGIFGGAIGVLIFGSPVADYFATFTSNLNIYDVVGSSVKAGLFGLFIAASSCYMGLNVSGGPEGVGRAVNRAVVVAFVAIFALDYAFSAILLAALPETSTLR